MGKFQLSLGITQLRDIRFWNQYFVDKTEYAKLLMDEAKHYYLARPSGFGKSLFLDTLKELFECNEALFRGLSIHGQWDWSVRYPVVCFDFSRDDFIATDQLHQHVTEQLEDLEMFYGVAPKYTDPNARLGYLINALYREWGQRVAVLVDGFDWPIVDALGDPDVARENRDFLHKLFSAVKRWDECIEFSFFTGVTGFANAGAFATSSNVRDITFHPAYSSICGFTDAELEGAFAPGLEGYDRNQIRRWCSGYSWLGEERLYNPASVVSLLYIHEFDYRCYGALNPASRFHDAMKRQRTYPVDIARMRSDHSPLSAFDLDCTTPEALLFQTGYLTIAEAVEDGDERLFRFDYPNLETRRALNWNLLNRLVPERRKEHVQGVEQMAELLESGGLDGLKSLMESILKGIPKEWRSPDSLSECGAYFASIFYTYFNAAGLDVEIEESTDEGGIDMTVETGKRIYIFEIKALKRKTKVTALERVKEKGYADGYRQRGKTIHLVGAEISSKTRKLARFETEQA